MNDINNLIKEFQPKKFKGVISEQHNMREGEKEKIREKKN